MELVKVKGGWKIKVGAKKIFPKIYKTKTSAEKRVGELERHSNK